MGQTFDPKQGFPKLGEGEVRTYQQLLALRTTTPPALLEAAQQALKSRDIRAWTKAWADVCKAEPDED